MPQASAPRWHVGILWTRLPWVELGPGMPVPYLPVAVLLLVFSKHAVEYWYLSYSRFIAGSVGKEAHVIHCDCSVDVALRGMPRFWTPLLPLTFDGNEEGCFKVNICIKLQKPVFEVFILFLSACLFLLLQWDSTYTRGLVEIHFIHLSKGFWGPQQKESKTLKC